MALRELYVDSLLRSRLEVSLVDKLVNQQPESVFPDTFTAAGLRNPVISSQPTSTYISEFGVRSPVLLPLGTEDRRVVNVQGEVLFYALLALGREVELLAFAFRKDTFLDRV
ncbi:hypothetical protein EDB86DRAFT_3092194 [Lactarius hatsudake]|nr:hypothetical protein EDB86DRAFT_3092194 [Lactarius hatsudake]